MDRKLLNEFREGLKLVRTPFIYDVEAERNLLKTQGKGFYYPFKIPLSDAHIGERYIFSGDRILITQLDSPAEIQLNSLKNPKIDLEKLGEIHAPFNQFFITNAAGSGYLKILVGGNGMFYPILGKPVPKNWDAQSADATGGLAIITPSSGKRWVITDLFISSQSALALTLKDGTTTLHIVYLAANGGAVSNFQTPIYSTTADNTFNVTASQAGNISIWASGYEVE